ncbi:isoprenylcysteine carboxyl methyltransferase, partial [Reticulomyxa filosa]
GCRRKKISLDDPSFLIKKITMSNSGEISTAKLHPPNNTGRRNVSSPRAVSIVQRIQSNEQFTSHKGIALNTIGGWLLGFVFGGGVFLTLIGLNSWITQSEVKNGTNMERSEPSLYYYLLPFSVYLIISAIFYTSEFIWHATFHPLTLDFDAFILFSHSKAFHYALLSSLIEYVLELKFFKTQLKAFGYLHMFGLLLVCVGQITRSMAMYTAGNNFTHLIATEKQSTHCLITHGIYKYFRHPSYVGWFYWSIGTQLLLCNPICFIAFALASWNFFKARIPLSFFFFILCICICISCMINVTPIGIPFLEQSIQEDLKKQTTTQQQQ